MNVVNIISILNRQMSVLTFACLNPPFLFLLAGALLEVQPLKMLISFSAALYIVLY